MGFDGLVRRWNSESDVEKRKGFTLFKKEAVQEVITEMSIRDFAKYGFKEESEWTPSVDNSLTVKLAGKTPVVVSFRNTEDRDSFKSMISTLCVCDRLYVLEIPQRSAREAALRGGKGRKSS